MSTVTVEKSHALGADKAKEALAGFAEEVKKYGLSLHWNGHKAELKGTGASGHVEVTDSQVRVVVKLGLLAKAAGVKAERVEGSLSRRLDEVLGSSTA